MKTIKNLFTILVTVVLFSTNLQAQVGAMHTLHKGGDRPDSENLVFTILPEAYSAAVQEEFINLSKELVDWLLNNYPFNIFKDRLTFYAIEVSSPDALNGYFGYMTEGRHSASTGVHSRVRDILDQYAPATGSGQVMMFTRGTGSGWGGPTIPGGYGAMALSGARNGFGVMVHELGHTFARLIDEYPPGNQNPQERANQTQNPDPETIRWRAWLGIKNGPTTVGIHRIDTIPDGRFYNSYAPTPLGPPHSCIMWGGGPNQEPIFCMVCVSEMIRVAAHKIGEIYQGNTNIKIANIPLGQTRIVDGAFSGCFELENVNIASTVNYIGDYAFLRCTSLVNIVNFAVEPQDINPEAFYGVDLSKITLRVPRGGSRELYSAHPVWGLIGTIGNILSGTEEPGATPTSIIENIATSVVTIYPNPVFDVLYIQSEEPVVRIQVLNLNGQLVKEIAGNQNQISVADLSSGIYVLRVTTTKDVATQRFVKL